MKTSVTAICCVALGLYGMFASQIDIPKTHTNTITAAQLPPLSPIIKEIHDTVTQIRKDTVHLVKYKTRTRTKEITRTVRDTVHILYIKSPGDRKEIPQDSVPTIKYQVQEAVDISEQS